MKVIEGYEELFIDKQLLQNKELNINTEVIIGEKIAISDAYITPMNDKQKCRLVLGELRTIDSKCAMLTALNMRISILTTSYDSLYSNTLWNDNDKTLLNNLKKYNYMEVNIGHVEENGKTQRKVISITEV